MKLKEFRIIYTVTSCLILTALVTTYVIFSPYKVIRKLPQISVNQVERVVLEARNTNKDLLQDSTFDLNNLINSYNQCKELKSVGGTTPDAFISIYLKDSSHLRISYLSKDTVSIGFKRSDGFYYQTNVRSEEIANLIDSIRKNEKYNNIWFKKKKEGIL